MSPVVFTITAVVLTYVQTYSHLLCSTEARLTFCFGVNNIRDLLYYKAEEEGHFKNLTEHHV